MSGQITGGQMGELPSLYSRSTPCCSSLADGDLNSTETFVMVSPRQYLLHILMRTEKYFGPLTACFWQTAVCYNQLKKTRSSLTFLFHFDPTFNCPDIRKLCKGKGDLLSVHSWKSPTYNFFLFFSPWQKLSHYLIIFCLI